MLALHVATSKKRCSSGFTTKDYPRLLLWVESFTENALRRFCKKSSEKINWIWSWRYFKSWRKSWENKSYFPGKINKKLPRSQLFLSSKSCNFNDFLFQAIQYLQKLCNHPSLVLTKQHPEYDRIISELKKKKSSINDIEHAPKFKALMQLLNDCGIGTNDKVVAEHRALIFCQHKSMLGEWTVRRALA